MKRILMIVALAAALPVLVVPLADRPRGASGAAGPAALSHVDLAPQVLPGEVLAASDAFGLPGDLEPAGKHLVLVDRMGEPAFHVLDRETGALLGSYGRRGGGPGEFEDPENLLRSPGAGPEDPELWLFDTRPARITRLRLADGRPAEPLDRSPSLTLRSDAYVRQAAWMEPERVLAVGYFFGGRLAEFGAGGEMVRTLGPLPPNPWGVVDNVLQHAHQPSLAVRPDRTRLAVGSRHAGMLELFAADGTLLRRVEEPFSFPPRFAVVHGPERSAMASGDDLRFGYVDVTASQERIYALFSGRTREGFPGRANYARHVHVFDWEGELRGVLEVDADLFTIAVDEREGRLYGTRHLPEPAVLRYDLPETLP